MANENQNTGPGNRQYVEDFFVYPVEFAALAPGGQTQGNIQIQADSDFKWMKSSSFADIAGGAQTFTTTVVPLVTVQVVDSGSGRQLLNLPGAVDAFWGSGSLPFVLPVPRIFRARSNIQITVANFSAAATYNLRLYFIGTKIFTM